MKTRLYIFSTFILNSVIIGCVSCVEENSTSTTAASRHGDLPQPLGSGDSDPGATYDDEDGYNGNEHLDSDDYGSDDSPTQLLNYSTEILPDDDKFRETISDNHEWNGFDGIICSDGTRFGNGKICDGMPDCYDCSDEENCTNALTQIFMCYDGQDDQPNHEYGYKKPRCIPRHQLCDGLPDCANGLDERQSDPGFKCTIKDKFRTCNLPDAYICDEIAHCEDESDLCKGEPVGNGEIKANETSESKASYSMVPDGFFQCLNYEILISLQQLCDGIFDCPDLSDECLCEVRRSSVVEKVCGGLCAKPLWVDQPENENCRKCPQGEIYWKGAQEVMSSGETSTNEKKNCFTPDELLETGLLKLSDKQAEPHELKNQDYDVIECLDQTLSRAIRARKCDGRPECFFGEDECGIDCAGGGNAEWFGGSGGSENDSSDPQFCRLLGKDLSFSCLSWLDEAGERKEDNGDFDTLYSERRISVCDGVIECADGSDEAFCPMRFKCTPDSNDTNVKTFDESQKCDEIWHCPNGEDELRSNCTFSSKTTYFPCDADMHDGKAEYFKAEELLDGKKACSTGADECPPFLSKIPEIREKFFEGISTNEQQRGISSHNKAIDNLPLQVFLIAAAFIGVSALAVSMALGVYNITVAFGKFCNSEINNRSVWIHNCLVCSRELVVNVGMTAAKVLLCAYFAFIRIKRSEDVNYSLQDLKWRSSFNCNTVGAVALIGSQAPIFTLAIFAGSYILLRRRCSYGKSRQNAQVVAENGRCEGEKTISPSKKYEKILSSSDRHRFEATLLCGSLGMIIASWLPVIVLALTLIFPTALHDWTQTYGIIRTDKAPTIFRANLLDREKAAGFASTVVAIKNSSFEVPGGYFSFSKVENVLKSAASSLNVKFDGSFGYFAHSGTCLPAFLVHANGGEAPFDMAVSNSWTSGLSIAILAIDFVLVVFTAALTTRYGTGLCKTCRCGLQYDSKERHRILNHTFSRFVLIESLTWLFIASLFFLKAVVPDTFSDYVYTVCCCVVLGVNCGMLTPFVLLTRKFRLQKTPYKSSVKIRPQYLPDSARIIEIKEEDDEEEEKPLTTTNVKDSPKDDAGYNERQNLVSDEIASVKHST